MISLKFLRISQNIQMQAMRCYSSKPKAILSYSLYAEEHKVFRHKSSKDFVILDYQKPDQADEVVKSIMCEDTDLDLVNEDLDSQFDQNQAAKLKFLQERQSNFFSPHK